MSHLQRTLEELSRCAGRTASLNALVGFDGFVDKIVHPVATRHGPGDQFDPIPSITDFGARISAAAGKSTNIELYPVTEKLGGNGPIMANALLAAGIKVRYTGALGTPSVHPVFEDFAAKTQAISITGPGLTTAAEFQDGKILFGDMQALDQVTYENLVATAGEGQLFDLFSRADLIAMVNWTMLPNLSKVFTDLIERVFPNLGPRERRLFFFDLADPAKRSSGDLREVLSIIKRFQNHGAVTLGLNFSEACQVATVLNLGALEKTPESLKQGALAIRRQLGIGTVVIHPTESAACASRDGEWWVPGPVCEQPKITTGAGDHFNAGFALGQLLGLSPEAALTVAVTTSGSYVRTGRSPSFSNITRFIDDWNHDKI